MRRMGLMGLMAAALLAGCATAPKQKYLAPGETVPGPDGTAMMVGLPGNKTAMKMSVPYQASAAVVSTNWLPKVTTNFALEATFGDASITNVASVVTTGLVAVVATNFATITGASNVWQVIDNGITATVQQQQDYNSSFTTIVTDKEAGHSLQQHWYVANGGSITVKLDSGTQTNGIATMDFFGQRTLPLPPVQKSILASLMDGIAAVAPWAVVGLWAHDMSRPSGNTSNNYPNNSVNAAPSNVGNTSSASTINRTPTVTGNTTTIP